MSRGYLGIPLLFLGACLGLGDLESSDETAPVGGSGGIVDSGWPDAFDDGASCELGTKPCGGSCVPNDDPNFGCSADDCAPCTMPGAKVYCQNLACVLDECLPGHLDCDLSDSTGCEVDANGDPNNCGACNAVCSSVNGSPSCTAGVCEVTCDPGFEDCDGNAANGCEADLTTSQHCGTCAKKCGTSFTCSASDCHCVNGAACDGGAFGECIAGVCHCAGGIPCPGGKKCTPGGCQ